MVATLLINILSELNKISSKGVNPKAIKDPLSVYQEVLKTQESKSVKNKGFRLRNNTIYTYEQDRAGLTYRYSKRKLHPDGITTSPLDITLSPWNIAPFQGFSGKSDPLSPDYPSRICIFGDCFGSAREAYNFIMCTENNSPIQEFVQERKIKYNVDWMEKRRNYMKEILIEKMRTNTCVRESLSKSHSTPLLYTVYDKYWGIGMSARLARVSSSHRGGNTLGELWEEIRELYNEEIQIVQCTRCQVCLTKRSDVKWDKEAEEYLCTYCIPSDTPSNMY